MSILQTAKEKNRLVLGKGIIFKLGGFLLLLIFETVRIKFQGMHTKEEWMKDKARMKHNPRAV